MDKSKIENAINHITSLQEKLCYSENNLQYIKRLQALKYWASKTTFPCPPAPIKIVSIISYTSLPYKIHPTKRPEAVAFFPALLHKPESNDILQIILTVT